MCEIYKNGRTLRNRGEKKQTLEESRKKLNWGKERAILKIITEKDVSVKVAFNIICESTV